MTIINIFSFNPEYPDSVHQHVKSIHKTPENLEQVDKFIEDRTRENAELVQKFNDLENNNHYNEIFHDYMKRVEYYTTESSVGKMNTTKVIFFKERGSFYTEEEVYMPFETKKNLPDYFKECLKTHLEGRFSGMIAFCLEPNHSEAFPQMVYISKL